MRAYVFTDPALASEAERFVWLSLDVEKLENAAFRERYPVEALPTFFVLDPEDTSVALRWVGGASASQLARLLEDAHETLAEAPGGEAQAADRLLERAERLYGRGESGEAVLVYREALATAPEDWPRRARAIDSCLLAAYLSGEYETAARLAREAWPSLAKTSSAANVASLGLDCALALDTETPDREALVASLEAAARTVVEDRAIPIAADDRSAVYGSLISAREAAGDTSGAREVARAWADYLRMEAEAAATPEQRTVYDSHRLSAHLYLNEPEAALPMLQASERDFPEDYNPPARLAVAYRAMERWDEALAASERALERVYGPRKLRVYTVHADILAGRGDVEGARRTLREAISYGETLPPGQRSASRLASLERRLEALR